jgi:endonuclease-3
MARPRAAAKKVAAKKTGRFVPPRRRDLPPTARGTAAGRIRPILDLLDEAYPDADCALVHDNPLQLLVSTILSAQCTDERVNIVTRKLFQRYRTAADYASAEQATLEKEIHSTGFFRNKAKNIIGMGRSLVEKHGAKVPRTMEEMLELPGVARKTANVVLGNAFGIASGIVVDTHVGRIAQRLGLSRSDDPAKIEADLQALVPRERWIKLSHQMILHGRRVCDSRKPRCGDCLLAPYCPSARAEA